jgi:hypothetical protein
MERDSPSLLVVAGFWLAPAMMQLGGWPEPEREGRRIWAVRLRGGGTESEAPGKKSGQRALEKWGTGARDRGGDDAGAGTGRVGEEEEWRRKTLDLTETSGQRRSSGVMAIALDLNGL